MVPGAFVIYESEKGMLDMAKAFLCPNVQVPSGVHYISDETAAANLEMSELYLRAYGREYNSLK